MNPEDESSKLTFEGERWQSNAYETQSQTPKIVQLVIKYSGGHIQDDKQATYVLIGFVLIVIIISLFVSSAGSTGTKQDEARAIIDEAIKATDAPR